MGNIGATELIVIALIAVLLFGAGRIADIGKGLGQGIKNFKQGIKEANDDDDEEVEEKKPAKKASKSEGKSDKAEAKKKVRVVEEESDDEEDEEEAEAKPENATGKKAKEA